MWSATVKDLFEILHQKEAALARVRQEVESLRIVVPLLADELDSDQPEKPHLMSIDNPLNVVRKMPPDLEATGTAGHVLSSILKRSK
jgi:hypothetical protein